MVRQVKVIFRVESSGNQKLEKIIGVEGLEQKERIAFASGADIILAGGHRYRKFRDYASYEPDKKDHVSLGLPENRSFSFVAYRTLIYKI